MTTKIIIDTRSLNGNGEAPLKIAVCKNGVTAYFPLDIRILPIYWDAKAQKVCGHQNKVALNSFIASRKAKFDNVLMQLVIEGSLGNMGAKAIRDKVAAVLSPKNEDSDLFLAYFKKFADTRKAANTKRIYNQTYAKLLAFTPSVKKLRFEDITKKWLESFESYLANERNNDTNTIAIDMRNIRAVVNDAIDNDITSTYSFRKKYKIKHKETRKRSLSLKRLRELFNYEVEPFQRKYLDTFKLCFFLIGINIVDLCKLTDKNIEGDRLEYDRSKTGRHYSVRIEPEALNILNRYRGKAKLFGPAEGKENYRTFAISLDRALKHIGPTERVRGELVRQPAFLGLSIYWARHTWATIAASLDIPKETISAALGHGIGNQTTSIYINFDTKKIDEANRKVIDYVLYDKK